MKIGRKEEGFGVLGMGKTTACFQKVGKVQDMREDVQKRVNTLGEAKEEHAIREIIGASRDKFNMLENI